MPAPYKPDDQQLRDRRDVGSRVYSLRLQANLTQEQLGEHTRMDRRTVGRLENGLIAPTLDQLSSIARTFGVPLWRLFRDG
ncbi:helix-turn-helix domain-containing protein [Kitasatospora sp. NPDC059408]|uniref:helix-turn-helix domain-containing protein n=1 Tax=Kitasatospora sp. NPDC059408 TaxID=3346823 RepID=UPI0036D11122